MFLCRRISLSVTLLVSVAVIAGVGAPSAMAAPTCMPEGTNIQGIGSSLQKTAQEIWTGREVPSGTPLTAIPHSPNAFPDSYREKCKAEKNPPTVSYTSTGSGMGLTAFGYTGGTLDKELAFIASDDGPNATQIGDAKAASGVEPVILPVSQTAIAVIVHLPAGCTLTGGITWQDLNKVFGGSTIRKWSEFSTKHEAAAGDCEHEITRVVRAEGSGTTFQFKHYLATLEEKLPCETEGHTHWAELEEVGAGEKPNIVWPECPTGHTPVVPREGGGAVAKYVMENPNTIGYAALPDAKNNGAATAKLQNGVVEEVPTYAEPGNTATSNARCANARYIVPPKGRDEAGNTGLGVNWSETFGAQPEVGGTEYPLCTLTYVAGWNEYTEAIYGTNAIAYGELVEDYIANYVVSTEAGQGQKAIEGHWYARLPTGVNKETDVQESAEFIASKLG